VEQKALVLLCVFPGSFNSDAAKSLIAHCTTNAQSVSVLQELIDRSLVEKLRTCRYEVHQLIQTFVQKIASVKDPALVDRGKKLACAHYISRLADNADLYWGLDTCKQSVDSFNEDRHNFEYFLEVYADMRSEIEDQVSVKSCKAFLLEAMELFKKCLGKLFMTADALKAIADLHASKKSETELDKSLVHYAEAIEIFEDLEFRQSKESILTLKNFGMCHMNKGNFR